MNISASIVGSPCAWAHKAAVRISAFKWVPPFAQGWVRDLRVRWALEEAGVPYAVLKLDGASDRPADYFAEQPFGQVPSYRDDPFPDVGLTGQLYRVDLRCLGRRFFLLARD
jgi:hypothetical protein